MNLMDLMAHFESDDKCRAYLERLRWPNGDHLPQVSEPEDFAYLRAPAIPL
jgi:hypothetical protein